MSQEMLGKCQTEGTEVVMGGLERNTWKYSQNLVAEWAGVQREVVIKGGFKPGSQREPCSSWQNRC